LGILHEADQKILDLEDQSPVRAGREMVQVEMNKVSLKGISLSIIAPMQWPYKYRLKDKTQAS
jgi:hypothetical protein